jgi:20S proteasome alpha/beta subunit
MKSLWAFLLLVCVCESSLWPLLSSTIMRGRSYRRSGQNEDVSNKLDAYGEIPQLNKAVQATAQANSIAVMKSSNQSLLVFMLSDALHKLLLPVGAQQLKALDRDLYLLCTGFAGDCRAVTRFARQVVVNHTMNFACNPSAGYVARSMGQYFQAQLSNNGARALACHAFICHISNSSFIKTTLYEIDPTGRVQEVLAGAAGRNRDSAITAMIQHLDSSSEGAIAMVNVTVESGREWMGEAWKEQLANGDKMLRAFPLGPQQLQASTETGQNKTKVAIVTN